MNIEDEIFKKSKVNFNKLIDYGFTLNDNLYKFTKYIMDNTNGDREQELPLVSEIFVKNVEESTYKIGDDDLPSYEITMNWLFERDLGYDVDAKLILVKDGEYISVVEESRVEENE